MTLRLLATLAMTLVLAACGSTVKLDEVPVEDAKSTAVSPQPAAAAPAATASGAASAATNRDAAPVRLEAAQPAGAGPTGAARIIYFDYDSFVIRSDAQATVLAHANWLKANRERRLVLEGHTDERGGREYNLALGQKRAEAVRNALVLLGAAESQIEAVSFGEEKPAETAATEEAYARNRRAEFNYR